MSSAGTTAIPADQLEVRIPRHLPSRVAVRKFRLLVLWCFASADLDSWKAASLLRMPV